MLLRLIKIITQISVVADKLIQCATVSITEPQSYRILYSDVAFINAQTRRRDHQSQIRNENHSSFLPVLLKREHT